MSHISNMSHSGTPVIVRTSGTSASLTWHDSRMSDDGDDAAVLRLADAGLPGRDSDERQAMVKRAVAQTEEDATVLTLADAGLTDDEGAREAALGLRDYQRIKARALRWRERNRHAEHMAHLSRIATALEKLAGL